MFYFELQCDCGYQSDVVAWGVKPGTQQQVVLVPIFDPATGILKSEEFPAEEGDATDTNFDLWIEKHKHEIRTHGVQAIVLIPAVYNQPFMRCPACQRQTCRATSAGIS